ncbi:Rha family transcriptional regulator [Thiomonas intermedia]|uniref:Rha family transcriptional regulator n=1 Tax=Thiomonas intermedia TaxID=926 RepID=UPI0012AB4FC8|nr:Rha family transcriptional regulator [Thiomonas intermedia]
MNQITDFQGFVTAERGQVLTDSRRVAKRFGKRHADVLRAYDRIECSDEFNRRNFASVAYLDSKGESRREVRMTKMQVLVLASTDGRTAYEREAEQKRDRARPAKGHHARREAGASGC